MPAPGFFDQAQQLLDKLNHATQQHWTRPADLVGIIATHLLSAYEWGYGEAQHEPEVVQAEIIEEQPLDLQWAVSCVLAALVPAGAVLEEERLIRTRGSAEVIYRHMRNAPQG